MLREIDGAVTHSTFKASEDRGQAKASCKYVPGSHPARLRRVLPFMGSPFLGPTLAAGAGGVMAQHRDE
jgi:hypothetical protein